MRSIAHGVPRYEDGDLLILEGAGSLALPDGNLQPIVDGGAWRIRQLETDSSLTDRSGSIYTLGASSSTRQFDAAGNSDGPVAATFAWHLGRIEDALGNAVAFSWARDGNQLYLASVDYGAYRIVFHYADRLDVLRWGRCGFLVTTRQRCTHIELRLPRDPQPLLRRWTLGYAQHELNGASLLTEVTLTGIDAAGLAMDAPTLSLGYTVAGTRTLTRMQSRNPGVSPGPLQRTGQRSELIDWSGTGLPDLLEIAAGGRARVWPNLGTLTWGRPQTVGALPLRDADAELALIDLDGDGMADVVRTDIPMSSYVPRTRNGFARPVSWRRAPPNAPGDPSARFTDADADGVADLVVAEGNALAIYYRSDPEGRSSIPQVVADGPASVATLRDPHVFLADMTGSGSDDLVRVDGGGVTYWPALGRGRFADPVLMANHRRCRSISSRAASSCRTSTATAAPT